MAARPRSDPPAVVETARGHRGRGRVRPGVVGGAIRRRWSPPGRGGSGLSAAVGGAVAAVLAALWALAVPGAPAAAQVEVPPVLPPVGPTPERYRNPVLDLDLPDPTVIRVGDAWWVYGTSARGRRVPVATGPDLIRWRDVGDALGTLPGWAADGGIWGPGAVVVDGQVRLYYSVRERSTGIWCVSVAVADDPAGPFTDTSDGPLVCQRDLGGTIDPQPVAAGDGHVLAFKSEGIAGREPTRLWAAPLSADGLRLIGEPALLLTTAEPWEGPIIENPALVEDAGRWFVLYAANRWETGRYATGWAACDSPLGPCRRTGAGPLMVSVDGAAGPGGAVPVTTGDGRRWLLYHAWGDRVGYGAGGARTLRADPLWVDGDRLRTDGPTVTEVPTHRDPPPPDDHDLTGSAPGPSDPPPAPSAPEPRPAPTPPAGIRPDPPGSPDATTVVAPVAARGAAGLTGPSPSSATVATPRVGTGAPPGVPAPVRAASVEPGPPGPGSERRGGPWVAAAALLVTAAAAAVVAAHRRAPVVGP